MTDVATIVRGSVPTAEFALDTTLERLSEASFETERIVTSGDGTVMPLLWIRRAERAATDRALEADPTVEGTALLADFDGELLYRMEWIDRIDLLLQMLTNAEATILDAYGRNDRWELRVLYPDREGFSATHEFCNEHGLTFDVQVIREMEGQPAGRFGLTEEQYRALATAAQRGYFAVPRDAQLQEVAEEFGLSHQALSERLRRGTEALVEDTLLVGELPHGLKSE